MNFSLLLLKNYWQACFISKFTMLLKTLLYAVQGPSATYLQPTNIGGDTNAAINYGFEFQFIKLSIISEYRLIIPTLIQALLYPNRNIIMMHLDSPTRYNL